MTPTRQAAVNGLAVVGFVTLIAAGVWLAVYSTRFVPNVVNGIGSAAVYLGSVLNPSTDTGLTVVPTPSASSTISFGTSTSTGTSTTPAPTPKSPTPSTTADASYTRPVSGAAATPVLYGLPDLTILVSATGYLALDGDLNSFVVSATVPAGKQPAVRFTVENRGTNVSGPWQITTDPRLASSAQTQPSLAPDSHTGVYTIYLDRINKSTQPLTITVSSDLNESHTDNNSISLTLTLD